LDHTDLDSVNKATEELRKQIHESLENPDLVDSPISQAITLSNLKRTDNPFNNTLSEMSLSINDISSRIARIEQSIFLKEKDAYFTLPSKIGLSNGENTTIEIFDKRIFEDLFGKSAADSMIIAARNKKLKQENRIILTKYTKNKHELE
jgi:hypothetical protein